MHTNSQKQANLCFFHGTKALFLLSRFWQSTTPRAYISQSWYTKPELYAHMERVLKHLSLKGHPNHQRAEQTTAGQLHVELKSDGI